MPRVGRVVNGPNVSLPWLVTDDDGAELAEVSEYLRHSSASDFSAASIKSYAQAILRWSRFLWTVGVAWDRADRAEVRDFVLWMKSAPKCGHRVAGSPAPGSVNPRTGKPYLGAGFAAATINHNLAVISAFYDYQLSTGKGPLRNPVPPRTTPRGRRVNAHHNPLEPFARHRRGAYRQRVPSTQPRAIPDRMFDELFEAMPSHRDRAILAFYVSTAARPQELLGVRSDRVDYGEQLVGVIRKGTRALQWLPASPDAFVWLRLYQNSLPAELLVSGRPVWWTLRKPWRPLNYEAMRAVLRRANVLLGTNWTLHDLRHTAAVRMAEDPNMPLVDIQVLLGHAHLSTTERYLRLRLDQLVQQVRRHHERRTTNASRPSTPTPSVIAYAAGDMQELFGWQIGSRR